MMRCMMTSQVLLLVLLAYSVRGDQISASEDMPKQPAPRTSAFYCQQQNKYCNYGQDCLLVNGTKDCVEPCEHYSVLDDPRRSVTFERDPSEPLSDNSFGWNGWYRLSLGGANAKMPETCVEESMCGATVPLWLSNTHPRPNEGVVRSNVCGAGRGSCCRYNAQQIHVKSCPGGFYIYKFVSPRVSNSAYCADISELATTTTTTTPPTTATTTPPTTTTTTTTPTPTTTTTTTTPTPTTTTTTPSAQKTTTTTVKPKPTTTTTTKAPVPDATTTTTRRPNPGTTTTRATPAPPRPTVSATTTSAAGVTSDPEALAPELVCGRLVMELGLSSSRLSAAGLDASSAHLADRLCSTNEERDGMVWYQVDRKEGSCGNTLTTNGSHAIFSNNIFVYPLNLTSGVLPLPIRIHFSCVYPMDTEASLDVTIAPHLALEGQGITGIGNHARASMSLFHNSNYTEPYPSGRVTLPVGSALHVGVSVEETETERFVVVLDDCYTTHTANPDDPMRYFLIQNKCPSDRRQVTVDESGSSLQARFSALLFLFQGDYRDVFLHCSLNLCDQTTSSCSPMCSRRVARSVASSVYIKPITIGPINWN